MACRNFASPAHALYRVLVSSPANNLISSNLLTVGQYSRHEFRHGGTPHLTAYRYYRSSKVYRPTKPAARVDEQNIVDNAIQSARVHLVTSEDEQFPRHQSLEALLERIDRQNFHLVQVSASSPSGFPVVKIVSKQQLREALEEERKRPAKRLEKTSKQLELGWGIERNDLEHRLKKLMQLLEEGRRVEVLLAHKKKSGNRRSVTIQEAHQLVQSVRTAALSVAGVREFAAMEGKLGAHVGLFFQPLKKHKGSDESTDNSREIDLHTQEQEQITKALEGDQQEVPLNSPKYTV